VSTFIYLFCKLQYIYIRLIYINVVENINIENLPHRKGVQAYIFNEKDELLIVCGASEDKFWKVPSGGVEVEESLETTVKREMKEELSVDTDILKKLDFKNKFDWSRNVIEEQSFKYRGQEQTIFIVRIKKYQKIVLDNKELQDYAWIKFNDINNYLKLESQRDMAIRVLKEYKILKKNSYL